MKGYFMLSEARSGSNWLGTLTNSTGVMGNLEEWLLPQRLGVDMRELSLPELQDRVFQLASTPNGRFAVKIFPGQLQMVQKNFGVDFIAEACRNREASLIFIRRRDGVRQAISLAKARATQQWRSGYEQEGEAEYDFDKIIRCFFHIERGYSFWRNYLSLCGLAFDEFVYEDLLENQQPYFDNLSDNLDVTIPRLPVTKLRIQRDEVTEEWADRFRIDLSRKNIAAMADDPRVHNRTLNNLGRFLQKRPMTACLS